MATLVNQLPLLFLLLLAFSTSQAIHARESQFFSKTSREEPKEAAAPSKGETPAATKKEDPPALPPQSHNGHGLYGRRPYRFSPTTTSSYGTYNYNGGARGNRHSTFQSGVPAGTELGGEEKFENGEEYHAVYNYGTRWKPDNNRPSSFSNEYETTPTTTTTPPEWKGETDPTKQYGMSDTRFLENGKYFYDVNAEGKQYAQRSYQWRGNPEGYEPYTGARTGGYGDRRYGSWRGGYGHSNAGEEYQGSQEDYVP
ncbi:hypothetical protein C4D60_Mb06t27800 [Musa balbisiana]|uniref:OCRE domain-containing protein n=1 Tax=Musa balbisiana TaxID=52838 RepID=A0A4S8ITN2_MUSBA|nr:hypothetical protein C4D60_Mb06t27800 [Musa balbisiana]